MGRHILPLKPYLNYTVHRPIHILRLSFTSSISIRMICDFKWLFFKLIGKIGKCHKHEIVNGYYLLIVKLNIHAILNWHVTMLYGWWWFNWLLIFYMHRNNGNFINEIMKCLPKIIFKFLSNILQVLLLILFAML